MAIVGNNSWKSITKGKGKYVVVGDYDSITTSTDGINWSTPIQLKDENGNIPENFLYGICPF